MSGPPPTKDALGVGSQDAVGGFTEKPCPAYGQRQFTLEEREKIVKKLRQRLPGHLIANRKGPGGSRVAYVESVTVVQLANDIFGADGWSTQITDQALDFVEKSKKREGNFNVGASAIVRVTLKNGSYHEDLGYGQSDNLRGRAKAIEKAKKSAITDGIKRALRLFGDGLGNCVRDKDYVKETQRGKHKEDTLEEQYSNPNLRKGGKLDTSAKNTKLAAKMNNLAPPAASTAPKRSPVPPNRGPGGPPKPPAPRAPSPGMNNQRSPNLAPRAPQGGKPLNNAQLGKRSTMVSSRPNPPPRPAQQGPMKVAGHNRYAKCEVVPNRGGPPGGPNPMQGQQGQNNGPQNFQQKNNRPNGPGPQKFQQQNPQQGNFNQFNGPPNGRQQLGAMSSNRVPMPNQRGPPGPHQGQFQQMGPPQKRPRYGK